MQDIESRLENSDGSWEHFDGTQWSIRGTSEGILVALNISPGVLPEEFNWSAIGISASVYPAFHAEQINLVISTNQPHSENQLIELFHFFLRNNIEDPNQVISSLEARQYLWGRPLGSLSEMEAQGLFGELFFMRHWLSDPLHQTIGFWDGPDRSLNDFNWTNLNFHVEVKTSRSLSPPLQHEITSPHQLVVGENHALLLFSMSARADQSGDSSLNSLIQEIRETLLEGGHYSTAQDFDEKLVDYGWNPNQDDFRFIVDPNLANLFVVSEGFPRIVPGTLENIVDPRVDIGSYTVTMTNLEDLRIDLDPSLSSGQLVQAAMDHQ